MTQMSEALDANAANRLFKFRVLPVYDKFSLLFRDRVHLQ